MPQEDYQTQVERCSYCQVILPAPRTTWCHRCESEAIHRMIVEGKLEIE